MKPSIFTARHYKALAAICRDLKVADPAAKAVLVEELAFKLGHDNPRFKPESFLEATAPSPG
jgi:hypothetical protein